MTINITNSLDIVDIAFESDAVQLRYLEITPGSDVISCSPYSGLAELSHSSFYGCDSDTRTCEDLRLMGNSITTSLGSSASTSNTILFSNTFCLAFHCFFNTLSEFECSSEKQIIFRANLQTNGTNDSLLPILITGGILSLVLIAILSFVIGHFVATRKHSSRIRKKSSNATELSFKSAHENLAYDGTMTGIQPSTGQTTLTSRIFERDLKPHSEEHLDLTQSGTNLHRGEGSSVSDVVLKLKMDSASIPSLYDLAEGVPSTLHPDESFRTWTIAKEPSLRKCDSWVQTTSMFDTIDSGTLTSYGTVIIHDSCSTNIYCDSATQSEGYYATITSQDETTWNSLVPSDRSHNSMVGTENRNKSTDKMLYI